jgi:hypothetical protein
VNADGELGRIVGGCPGTEKMPNRLETLTMAVAGGGGAAGTPGAVDDAPEVDVHHALDVPGIT